MSVEHNLEKLGLKFLPQQNLLGATNLVLIVDNMAYISGQGPFRGWDLCSRGCGKRFNS